MKQEYHVYTLSGDYYAGPFKSSEAAWTWRDKQPNAKQLGVVLWQEIFLSR